jgi:hypothetical protein
MEDRVTGPPETEGNRLLDHCNYTSYQLLMSPLRLPTDFSLSPFSLEFPHAELRAANGCAERSGEMAIRLDLQMAKLFGAVLASFNAFLMGINLPAAEKGPMVNKDVTVCIESGITAESSLAQAIAGKIFADIGVMISWHDDHKCPAGQDRIIHIHLDRGLSAECFPGAYALPYEGIHIQVFADRIKKLVSAKCVPILLAHVMAHEIAHILQGIHRHSTSGIMKEKWNHEDCQNMVWKPLTFTEYDIRLIHSGLEHRASKASRTGLLATNQASEAFGVR